MKDNRVTLLQAKRLKRMGYNNPSTAYSIGNTLVKYQEPNDWNHKRDYSNLTFPYISIPTCDEVIEWLYNKYNIYIHILILRRRTTDLKFLYTIIKQSKILHNEFIREFRDFNCAKRAAIAKALTLIENHK